MRRKEREVTDIKEIREVLDSCKVCRLGIADEGGAYIVPLNYGYRLEDGVLTLYFHGAKEGKKLDLIRKNPELLFCQCDRKRKSCDRGRPGGKAVCAGKADETSDRKRLFGIPGKSTAGADGGNIESRSGHVYL